MTESLGITGFVLAILPFLASFVLVSVASGQQQPPSMQQPLQSTSELVKVSATVTDDHGNFIGGLTRENFRIFDNHFLKPLAFFAPVDTPAIVLVMIETGPAVYLLQKDHLTAAYALLDGLAPEDQVALVSYDQQPRQILAFTRDKMAAFNALGTIQYDIGMGELHLYDSLSTVVDWLRPVAGKRAMILLTTGLDSSPAGHWDALVRKLHSDDLVIFPVALGGSLRGYAGKKATRTQDIDRSDRNPAAANSGNGMVSFASADRNLRNLAAITGGRAYFPGPTADFSKIYREIAAGLRHQYVLGFEPAHDAVYHSITVSIVPATGRSSKSGKSKYRVLAREGYFAPRPANTASAP